MNLRIVAERNKWGIEVCVHDPFRMGFPFGRLNMEAHRNGKGVLKHVRLQHGLGCWTSYESLGRGMWLSSLSWTLESRWCVKYVYAHPRGILVMLQPLY
jgi:hypothetical protein